MAGAVHSLGLHLVWCSKYRRPVLVGEVADRLHVLMHQKAAERGWSVEALQVMPDHVHVLVRTGPDAAVALVAHHLKQLKGFSFSSRVLRGEFPHLRSRLPTLWSRSYLVASVASVGRVSKARIRQYIVEQTTRPGKGRP